MTQDLRNGFRIGEYDINPSTGKIAGPNTSQRVQPKVIEVLMCLASRPRTVIDRESLHEDVWGTAVVSDDSLTRCISILRHVFNDVRGDPHYIQTLPKRGYRLLQDVEIDGHDTDVASTLASPGENFDVTKAAFDHLAPQGGAIWQAGIALDTPLVLAKQPSENRLYEMDFTPRMNDGEMIESVVELVEQTVEPHSGASTVSTDLVFAEMECDEHSAKVRISAGTNSTVYKVTFIVNSSLKNVLEADGILIVYDT
jgi:DNA-binding winged helix-turn-helix (wHTH) protein